MSEPGKLTIDVMPYDAGMATEFDYDRILFDLDSKIDLLSSKADKYDYLVAAGSGMLSALLDILWVGKYSLMKAREFTSHEIDGFVQKAAKLAGFEGDGLTAAVEYLEDAFHIPSDGNTHAFGGPNYHHLKDFAHHPTIVGLLFSLLTQFSEKSYGLDSNHLFVSVDILEDGKKYIGETVPQKIVFGTVTWFFHLISDMAGSRTTAGKSGGTGIPGPLLSLAEELSALPVFKSIRFNEQTIADLARKFFDGSFTAANDTIFGDLGEYKFDLRGELGVATMAAKQMLPVVANETLVRTFYVIRRLALAYKEGEVASLEAALAFSKKRFTAAEDGTLPRMLTISTGIFTTLDIGEAVVTQQYWVAINYPGVGRFAVAVGQDVSWGLQIRDVKKIQQVYEGLKRFTYRESDNNIYERIGRDMDMTADKFGLTIEQTEILYNIEYYKTLNDIQTTRLPVHNEAIKSLKQRWLNEWKDYMTIGFPAFLNCENAEMHWYSKEELLDKIEENDPENIWFRLVLLEAMLFEPYYPLSIETDKKGKEVPSKRYKDLQNRISGYRKSDGDAFLDTFFVGTYYIPFYIKRLRKCYDKVLRELNEVLKTVITTGSITAAVALLVVATAGALAPSIAVALVGSNFAGLSGAALTNACLAYIGGGAVAFGGAGMAGGTIAIVGGGAVLGIGVGAGIGGTVGVVGLTGKKNTILQSAKLLVSVREIFLNDEHDIAYSNSIYEKYTTHIMDIEKGVVELKLRAEVASDGTKKELKEQIKKAEESIEAMKIARKSLARFMSSFQEGLAYQQGAKK